MAVVDGKEILPFRRLLAANFGDRPDRPLLAGSSPWPSTLRCPVTKKCSSRSARTVLGPHSTRSSHSRLPKAALHARGALPAVTLTLSPPHAGLSVPRSL